MPRDDAVTLAAPALEAINVVPRVSIRQARTTTCSSCRGAGTAEGKVRVRDVAYERPHWRWMKSVASSRCSVSVANDSAMRLIGSSGLLSAARPSMAQYSICLATVRCSRPVSLRAWPYSVWSMQMEVEVVMAAART